MKLKSWIQAESRLTKGFPSHELDINAQTRDHVRSRIKESFHKAGQVLDEIKAGKRFLYEDFGAIVQSTHGMRLQYTLAQCLEEKIRDAETVQDYSLRRSSYYILTKRPIIPINDPRNSGLGYNPYQCNCVQGRHYGSCKHTIALGLKNNIIQVPDDWSTAIIERRRARGRPKKARRALQNH